MLKIVELINATGKRGSEQIRPQVEVSYRLKKFRRIEAGLDFVDETDNFHGDV